MMGRLNRDQGRLFYSFCLDEAVPVDHRARQITTVLDLSWCTQNWHPTTRRSAALRSIRR